MISLLFLILFFTVIIYEDIFNNSKKSIPFTIALEKLLALLPFGDFTSLEFKDSKSSTKLIIIYIILFMFIFITGLYIFPISIIILLYFIKKMVIFYVNLYREYKDIKFQEDKIEYLNKFFSDYHEEYDLLTWEKLLDWTKELTNMNQIQSVLDSKLTLLETLRIVEVNLKNEIDSTASYLVDSTSYLNSFINTVFSNSYLVWV